MTKFISKICPGVINAKSKPSFRHAETLRTAVSVSNKKGFTLIELLVVVLIIGILSSVALPQYTKAVEKARAVEAKTVLGDLLSAEEIYKLSTGSYTTDLTALDIELPSATASGTARTKNYNISVNIMDSGCLRAVAARANNGVAVATGSQAYKLEVVTSNPIGRFCTSATDDTFCKAIADRTCAQPSGDWCHVGAGLFYLAGSCVH